MGGFQLCEPPTMNSSMSDYKGFVLNINDVHRLVCIVNQWCGTESDVSIIIYRLHNNTDLNNYNMNMY